MDRELKALRKELAVLGDEFSQRVSGLERRIAQLESKHIWIDTGDIVHSVSNYGDDGAIEEKIVVQNTSPAMAVPGKNESIEDVASVKFSSEMNASQQEKKAADWVADSMVQDAGRQGLFALIAPLLGPFSALFNLFSKVYRHYQEQGKAPVFFMTVTGIIALVFGFGYLLQYSFNEYLGPISKVAIGFVCAIAVTVGGVRFTRKSDGMAEYGSSIIALGLIMGFLCAYFAGPYYRLLPDFLGFLLLIAVTAMAYFLALLFETRVIAVVTLVGGVAMPIVMGHVDYSPQLFLSYLLVLSIAMLKLSKRIEWSQLAYASMALSAAMIEFSIMNREQSLSEPFGLIAIVHGFFYVFGYYALQGLNSSEMSKSRLMIISSNLLFYLFFTQQLTSDSAFFGSILLANLLPWIGLFLIPNKVFGYTAGSESFRTVQILTLLHAGLLAGLGVLVLSSPELMGVMWCLEALMLIYLGGKFQFISVRIEGYLALLISMVTMGAQVAFWLSDAISPAPLLLKLELGVGWANLIALTALLYASVVLLKQLQDDLLGNEKRLLEFLDNLLSIGLSLSFMLTIGIYLEEGMWLFAIMPMFYLIWRAKHKDLVVTELFGLGHLILLIVPILASAEVSGNFHFSEQSIYAQVARVEAFVGLWLIAEFYKRYFPESRNIVFTENLRKIFYGLIPLLFLPKVLREYSDYFPIALWLSSAIALFLYSRLQYKVMQLELRILVSVASVAAIVSCGLVEFTNWTGNAVEALCIGLIFHALTGWYGKALLRTPAGSDLQIKIHGALKPIFALAAYYFGLALFIVCYKVSSSIEFGMLMSLFYFASYFFVGSIIELIRSTLRPAYLIIFVLLVLLTVSHALSAASLYLRGGELLYLGVINTLAIVCVGTLIFRPGARVRAVWQITGRRIVNLWIFNLISVGAYVSLLSQLFTDMLGPIVSFFLVAHATIILFQTLDSKLKKLIWLSGILYGTAAIKVLLWDMSDFSLIQKIVVFMLIGVCMLGAAFKFQKLAVNNLNV